MRKSILRCFLLSLCLVLFPVHNSIPAKTLLPKNFDKSRYQRIAIIVCRMNSTELDLPSPITLEFDYANRNPKFQLKSNTKLTETDIYIDDERRLKEVIPGYPLIAKSEKSPKFEYRYYKNVSPQIYQAISAFLNDKGYQANDLKKLGADWEKPFSEMTVAGICNALKGTTDALLVFHYTDCGFSYVSEVSWERIDQGFSKFAHKIAMFDIQTEAQLLEYDAPMINLNSALHREYNRKNPDLKGRLEILPNPQNEIQYDQGYWLKEKKGLFFSLSHIYVHRYSEEEMIDILTRYIIKGNSTFNVIGLEKLIP